ncbi:MAG: ATP-binding protein, partial [Bacteroidetes bacterium]|nr:ATP-binding protein [Bacteroidota bacterium]
ILEGMQGAENLLERLKKYTEGTFAGLLNHSTNVELKNQLVVFSIRDLEDELRPIALYTIVNYVWNIVRSEIKKRILIIDEAWWMMQHKESALFLRGLVRRGRKYFFGVTTITQDVVDFLDSEDGRDIATVTNSALLFLFKQTPAAIDKVAKTFNLTEGEQYYLLNCSIGEGLIFAGSKHVAIQVVASYTEDQLITTDPQQLLEIEQAKREYEESVEGDNL